MSTISDTQARDIEVIARNLARQVLGRYWYADADTAHEEQDRLAADIESTVRTYLEQHDAPTFAEHAATRSTR